MQIVDTIFVGHLSPEAIGGVGVGNALYSTLLMFGFGVLFGLDFPISHSFGAGRVRETHEYLVQALYLCTLVSWPLMVGMVAVSNVFHTLGVTPAVADQAAIYLRTLSWSLWPTLLFMAFRQYLQGMGVAAPVLWILVIANLGNVLGNWVFIFGH